MKIKNPISITLVLLFILSTNCQDSFLDVQPTTSLSANELSTKEGLEGALIGSYSMLMGRTSFINDSSNWIWGSIMGGDANKGTVEADNAPLNEVQAYAVQSNNGAVLDKYSYLYEGIARANNTLRLLEVAEESVTEATLLKITAEARFLRGHFYFELKKAFNNTPYVDENWDETSPVPNNQDLWQFIEADFEFAYTNLPETHKEYGRANKWAAGTYLGKTYLYQQKYAAAKPLFDALIANGNTTRGQAYNLVPYYADAFRAPNDNNEESIFAAQAAVGTGSVVNANLGLVLNFPHGGSGRPGGCCGFFQPSFDLANSYRTQANGLPYLDNSFNEPDKAILNDMGLSSTDSFQVDKGNLDPRLDHTIGRRGIPYLDWGLHPGKNWIRDQAYGGPYSPKKFSYYEEGIGTENDASSWTPAFTSVNYNLIRFADALLMAAEVEIELNNLDIALDYINRVRNRAKNSPIPNAEANYVIQPYPAFTSQAEARRAVRLERKLELGMEGHRFFDLVRWGIAAETLNPYLQHENQFITPPFQGATFTAGKNEYLPIPQTEIDLQGSEVLQQNSGY